MASSTSCLIEVFAFLFADTAVFLMGVTALLTFGNGLLGFEAAFGDFFVATGFFSKTFLTTLALAGLVFFAATLAAVFFLVFI